MKNPTSIAAAAVLLFALVEPAAAQDSGFTPLFASEGLAGWTPIGKAGFTNRDGTVTCDGSGDYPTWLRSDEVFESFVLRFEYKLGLYGEGGVFLHAPRQGRNSRVGFEIQLSDDTRNPGPVVISSGAIYGSVPPTKQASRPLGEWNQVEVLFDGPSSRSRSTAKWCRT